MSVKNQKIIQVAFTTLIVSLSYFIGSVFLKGTVFYTFDFLWRLSIILTILFVAKFNPLISSKQWSIFTGILVFEVIVYKILAPAMPLVRILISTALAPILEEFLFRGWMIDKIEGSSKEKIIYTSLFFSLYHLKNINVLTLGALFFQMIYAGLLIGPILAYARLKYNSLFVSLILHSGNNTIADTISSKIIPFIAKRQGNFN